MALDHHGKLTAWRITGELRRPRVLDDSFEVTRRARATQRDRRTPCLVWSAIALNLTDAILTHAGPSLGFQEANIVAASLMAIGLFLPYKVVLSVMIYAMRALPRPRVVALGLSGLVAMFAASVTWNLAQLARVYL